MNSKIFTSWKEDDYGKILGTQMMKFESVCGVGGLARENGDCIELLAVASFIEGKGMFRDFIALCKQHYKTICIWHVDNPKLPPALLRYGFQPDLMIDRFGFTMKGFRWDK